LEKRLWYLALPVRWIFNHHDGGAILMRKLSSAILLAAGLATAFGQTAPVSREQEFVAAADRGDAAAVRRMIAGGLAVDGTAGHGTTALIAATQRNQLDVAMLLVRAGADANRQDDAGQSAFLIAAGEGNPELLRLMLGNGADVLRTDSAGNNVLIRAAGDSLVLAPAYVVEPMQIDQMVNVLAASIKKHA
jgi:hypothetical protein